MAYKVLNNRQIFLSVTADQKRAVNNQPIKIIYERRPRSLLFFV